jgi:hypothetical protein
LSIAHIHGQTEREKIDVKLERKQDFHVADDEIRYLKYLAASSGYFYVK